VQDDPAVNIWISDDRISLVMTADRSANSQFQLYDISGRKLLTKSYQIKAGKNVFFIPAKLKPGVFVVNIKTQGKEISKKIFYGKL
jgi:myo-inositol-hexaphosphate 3-phosphohydrolase